MTDDTVEDLVAREREIQSLRASIKWIKSPAEACSEERAAGNGGCGACSICCGELRERVERCEEALREVVKGEGRFSLDPLTHASNTIEDMRDIARRALSGYVCPACHGHRWRSK